MSVELAYRLEATVVETLSGNPDSAPDATRKVTHTEFNSADTLDGTTTPPVTKVAAFTQALTAGAATIDLAALVGTNGAAVNGTGLKVQLLKMKNVGTNVMSIAVGAANGYDLAGSDFKVTLAAGQEFSFLGNDATPDIAGADKELDLAGTGSEEAEIIIVMG